MAAPKTFIRFSLRAAIAATLHGLLLAGNLGAQYGEHPPRPMLGAPASELPSRLPDTQPTLAAPAPVAMSQAQGVDADKAKIPDSVEARPSPANAEQVKAEAASGDKAKETATACGAVDWTKIPPVRPLQRPGYFTIAPTGPGYYSLQDVICNNCREKPPVMPFGLFAMYPPSFFDTDYRYLDNPKNTQHDYMDCLKRIHCCDDWLLSLGGQTWARFMDEHDSRLTNVDNDYTLYRARVFADLWYRDCFRIFAEYMYADIFNPELNPLPIDVNRSDAQNLFFELKLFSWENQPAYVRTGRQEMTFGSQRLISPPDWANIRRTFQGARGYRQGEKWDVDLFWVQPVLPNRNHFDSVDDDQNFAGAWVTYRPQKGSGIDMYFLNLDQARPVVRGQNNKLGGFNVSTVGNRYYGDCNHILYDFEGMLQFGDYSNQDLFAGAGTAGLGYHLADLPFNPQVWAYYDYASGTSNPGKESSRSTFNQLFPFGHFYFGYLDLVGRQNIHDISSQFVFYPVNWITCLAQFHHFFLDSPRDALYNAAGVATRIDPTGKAGRDVGNEVDLLVSFHLSTHSDVLIGWSKLFSGRFIDQSGPAVSPELFYAQYGYRW